jgi:aminoglycoside 3-N-acetyltransferase
MTENKPVASVILSSVLNFVRRAWSGSVHPGELERALNDLGLDGSGNAIVHSSLSSFGYVSGGAVTLIEALRHTLGTVVMPAFTYYTLAWPAQYRSSDWPKQTPLDGPAFRVDSNVSPDIGKVSQTLLDRYAPRRSTHPALSFVALGARAEQILAAQSLENPYAPIGTLYALDGDVILLGVDHRSNTTIHYGEYLAGRPLLDRWANTVHGLVRTFFPNCSAAFNGLQGKLSSLASVDVGRATITRMRVRDVVDTTIRLLEHNPEALLCQYSGCRCQAVRDRVRRHGLTPRHDWVLQAIPAPQKAG